MTLIQMTKGQDGVIKGVDPSSNARSRLFDLGVLPGSQIRYLGKAPFNGGVLVEVKKSVLMIRKELARAVQVWE